MKKLMLFLPVLLIISGCVTASQHASDVAAAQEGNKVTVGTVQTKIKKGMSSAAVVEALGSPNMVSTDEQNREVWVYDKISTMKVASTSETGFSLLLLGSSSGAGASSTSQRTLTIIIKFDNNKKVRDYAYNYSSF